MPRRRDGRAAVLRAPRRHVRPARRSVGVPACPLRPTPSSTPTRTSRSSTAPPPRTTWSRGPSSWAWPAWPSRITRACTASSGSPRPPRRPACTRSSGSRWSWSTRRATRTGSSSRRAARRRRGRRLGDPVAAARPRRRRGRGTPRPAPARRAPGSPAIASPVKEDLRGIGERERGPHLVLLARDDGRVPEPVPARLAGEHGRDEGRAALQPGAPGRARRGARRAVGLPRTGSSPGGCWAGDRAGARAVGGTAMRGARTGATGGTGLGQRAPRPPDSSSSCRTTSCPTTTGSWPRPPRSPGRSACRSWSPTTSTTPAPRTASSTTS